MSDFSKVYCNLHPHELITNFCTKPQCLKALCANCICTHTQQHIQENTAPIYENIRQTYKTLHQQLRNKVDQFQQLRGRITNIKSKVYSKRSVARQAILKAREDSHHLIDEYFDQKTDDLLKEIQATQRNSGLHCESRLDGLQNHITRQISCLVTASQQASMDSFIQIMPRVRGKVLQNANILEKQISMQVKQNENFSTVIQYKRQSMNGLRGVLNTVIRMDVSKGERSVDLKKQSNGDSSQIQKRPVAQNLTNQRSPSIGIPIKMKNQRNSRSQLNFLANPNFHPTQKSMDVIKYNQNSSYHPQVSQYNPQYIPHNAQQNITQPNPRNKPQSTPHSNNINNNSSNRQIQMSSPNRHPLKQSMQIQMSGSTPYPPSSAYMQSDYRLSMSRPQTAQKQNKSTISYIEKVNNGYYENNNGSYGGNGGNYGVNGGNMNKKSDFQKISLSKKPRKSGLRVINQHITETDSQHSVSQRVINNHKLSQSRIQN